MLRPIKPKECISVNQTKRFDKICTNWRQCLYYINMTTPNCHVRCHWTISILSLFDIKVNRLLHIFKFTLTGCYPFQICEYHPFPTTLCHARAITIKLITPPELHNWFWGTSLWSVIKGLGVLMKLIFIRREYSLGTTTFKVLFSTALSWLKSFLNDVALKITAVIRIVISISYTEQGHWSN